MLTCDVKSVSLELIDTDVLVVPIIEGQNQPVVAQIDALFSGHIQSLFETSSFSGKFLDKRVVHTLGKLAVSQLIFIGMGSLDAQIIGRYRDAAGEVARLTSKAKSVGWLVDEPHLESEIVEGFVLGGYSFTRYQSTPQETVDQSLTLYGCKEALGLSVQKMNEGRLLGKATNLARDLANTAPNHLMPIHFIEFATQLLSPLPIDIEIIDRKAAEALGMGAFLCVAQGSLSEAYMLVMRYRPKKEGRPIALIGKGVTFDSGGISIKPGKGMSDMKADMSGAAAVLAAMQCIATLALDINITAIVPLTENMPSASATRPGDVVTAMNGKTIEIINTDAEGRLILSDAISYAVEKEDAEKIVDIATLTGACSIALGDLAGGVLGNNQPLINELITAGISSGEWLWQLPLFEGYLEYLKSDVADIANASELGKAGTCTGAKFLEQFVGTTPWAHLDIASVMKRTQTKGCQVKGMSGVGARLLIQWIVTQSQV